MLRECSLLLKAANGFQCEEAAARCAAMPAYLRASGFVQGHVGKAYYDNGQHAAAERCFAEMYRLEPFKIDPKLAYYSSCLWQLQRERQLAHLAQELVQMDKLSLVTQIVLGNTHSIVGYHENAIQFFTRACNLDPYHAYSNTLRGMEHLVLEELDDASQVCRRVRVCCAHPLITSPTCPSPTGVPHGPQARQPPLPRLARLGQRCCEAGALERGRGAL